MDYDSIGVYCNVANVLQCQSTADSFGLANNVESKWSGETLTTTLERSYANEMRVRRRVLTKDYNAPLSIDDLCKRRECQ